MQYLFCLLGIAAVLLDAHDFGLIMRTSLTPSFLAGCTAHGCARLLQAALLRRWHTMQRHITHQSSSNAVAVIARACHTRLAEQSLHTDFANTAYAHKQPPMRMRANQKKRMRQLDLRLR